MFSICKTFKGFLQNFKVKFSCKTICLTIPRCLAWLLIDSSKKSVDSFSCYVGLRGLVTFAESKHTADDRAWRVTGAHLLGLTMDDFLPVTRDSTWLTPLTHSWAHPPLPRHLHLITPLNVQCRKRGRGFIQAHYFNRYYVSWLVLSLNSEQISIESVYTIAEQVRETLTIKEERGSNNVLP